MPRSSSYYGIDLQRLSGGFDQRATACAVMIKEVRALHPLYLELLLPSLVWRNARRKLTYQPSFFRLKVKDIASSVDLARLFFYCFKG